MREAEAAGYLQLAPKTLARWRWAGKGPNYSRLGAAVRYAVAELDIFIASGKIER
ncbi:helix-turn-helix transcriptional regulator [Novosphingobium sp.]|uniref:helix-turn-helix transcriptional regulator n=1 Tax=Novosphingobium sp. TaxID=1874826 RepID=UPI003B52F9B7